MGFESRPHLTKDVKNGTSSSFLMLAQKGYSARQVSIYLKILLCRNKLIIALQS